ncbi:sigma-70 family RNA polymerase sigma factor [bacterium]|nr:sigma-70 family RNA polymerase sigma factor [bacterium]
MGALMHKPSLERQDDSLLVQGTLDGDARCFEVLVERYQRRLFGLVRHYTRSAVEVEDIVQDTFLKAFSRLETFQQSSAFYTWLYRIAVNTILDFMKRQGRSPIRAVEDPEAVSSSVDETTERKSIRPDARLEQAEISEITRSVMDDLPEIFRTVLVMRELEQMRYQDIADVLQVSIGTVESRLFRARARFKKRLLQLHPEFAASQSNPPE